MNEITRNLINQAADGDRESFEEIYKACSGYVYNVVYRILGNQQSAEEATQDVFLIIYRKLSTFRFASSFKTWVYRIAVNISINYVKRMNKERNRTVEFKEELFVTQQPNPIEQKGNKQFSDNVVTALLDRLNPDQRACIVLRSIQGLSYQEISETLNVNINTVRTRLKRARITLLALKNEVVRNAM